MKAPDDADLHAEGKLPEDPMADAEPANGKARKESEAKIQVFSVAEMFRVIVDDAKAGKPAMGLRTGHYKLDSMLCGLRRGNVTTLGARTSFGKTSKALQISDLAIRDREEVLYISGEDNEKLCGKRFMAMRAKINALRLRANECTTDEIEKMEREVILAEKTPFFVNGIGVPVEDLCEFIIEHCKEHDVALVVADYLQKFSLRKSRSDRRGEVTDITKRLSDTIKQVNAAGLLLSQCSRPESGNRNRKPSMFDLKESGDIENGSEAVILGHVEEIDDTGGTIRKRSAKVEKNKDGPVFDEWIDLPFDEVTASFSDVRGHVYDNAPATHYTDDNFADIGERM